MKDISIIGAGRLGTSLGYALREKGYRIRALSCKSPASAEESRRIIGGGKPLADNREAARKGKIVFLCVPDEEIKKVARELSRSDIPWSEKVIYHCSGLLSSAALNPLRRKGARIGSFHPIQSFPCRKADTKQFKGIFFGLEGEKEALLTARTMVHELGGRPLLIKASEKPLYHAACSIASNFFVVLLDMAASLLDQMELGEDSLRILFPLVKGTLHNVKKFDTASSLTGPLVRGDRKSIEKHLEALGRIPAYRKVYSVLARQALEMAQRESKLPPTKIRALRNLLEEK
ncbi:MAG: Rossmann-like and DUF2520 domain-containing protein [Candidatus Aminicenantales bacterium]